MDSAGEEAMELSFGQFLGRVLAATNGPGFAVREVADRPAGGVPPHTHAHAHFCLIISGAYETTTANHRGTCPSLTLLFHPAGTTHADSFLGPKGRCLTVSLGNEAFDGFGPLHLPEHSITLSDVEHGFPASRLRYALRDPDGFSPMSVEGLVLELIGCLCTERRLGRSAAPGWLDRALRYLRDAATVPARVTDVAEEVGVHPVHLARVFRRHVGVSPGEYLRRVRIRRAMALAERSSESLASIAFASGFCDQSEMTKAFRRELGTTPAAYRRAVRA